jgi:cell division protein FtsQ
MDETNDNIQAVTPSGKKHFLLLIALAAALLGLALYANAWKDNRRVAKVVVEGNRIVPSREIIELADVPLDELMFAIDLYVIEQRILKQPYVKSAAVHRDLPDRIRITIEEREPVAVLAQGTLNYLDAEGYVLPAMRTEAAFDLPVLSVSLTPRECVVGRQTTNSTVREALQILTLARAVDEALYRNISEINADGAHGFVFYTAEYGIPVYLGRERIGAKLVTFSEFWKQIVARQGAHALEVIDLRFEDQVVVRWNRRTTDVHS